MNYALSIMNYLLILHAKIQEDNQTNNEKDIVSVVAGSVYAGIVWRESG
jgi:hypothetical protein